MARLIDAETLLKKIQDTAEGLADCDQQNAAWALRKYAVRDIMDAEAVDAVEVVRCRDCKQWGDVTFGNVCRRWSAPLAGMKNCTKPDDFCSCGERKENENV